MKRRRITEQDFTLVTNNSCGHPRYVIHFLRLNTTAECDSNEISTTMKYEIALGRARALNGRKFSNRQYGGGIVFVSWNLADTVRDLNDLMARAEKKQKADAKKTLQALEAAQ